MKLRLASLFSMKYVPLLATTGVFLALYTAAAIHYQNFFTVQVFINFLTDNSFLGIIAVGMTLVIISGGIDLSVGAVLALCSVVIGLLIQNHGASPALAILVALALGTSLGFVHGCIVRYLKIEPFIATLAGMFFARGLALIIEPGGRIGITSKFFSWVSGYGIRIGEHSFLPVTAMIFLVVLAAGIYIAGYTAFGRNVYAAGGSADASLLMGLPVGQTKLLVYTVSGFCSALAAVVFTFYQSAGNTTAGVGMELDAIAAVVIGGTLLTGGTGSVFGTLIGVLILGIIQTGVTFQGNLSSWWTKVAIGVLVLIFIVLQKFLSRSVYKKH